MLHVHVSLMEGKPCKFPLQTMYRNYGYQLRTNINSKKDGGKKKTLKVPTECVFYLKTEAIQPALPLLHWGCPF